MRRVTLRAPFAVVSVAAGLGLWAAPATGVERPFVADQVVVRFEASADAQARARCLVAR